MRYAAALAVLIVFSGCNPQAPRNSATSTPSPSATASGLALKISGSGTSRQPVRIVSQKDNREQYELLTRSFISNGAQGAARANFRNVHVTFFAKDGTRLVTDAPRAVLDQTANTVTLADGVKARNDAGMTLQCDELVYDRSDEMIHGTGHVIITDKNGLRATGHRFDSDITLTHTQMQ